MSSSSDTGKKSINADTKKVYVSNWDAEEGTEVAAGKYFGINAFTDIADAVAAVKNNGTVQFDGNAILEEKKWAYIDGKSISFAGTGVIKENDIGGGTVGSWVRVGKRGNATLTIKSGADITIDNQINSGLNVSGAVTVKDQDGKAEKTAYSGRLNIEKNGKLTLNKLVLRGTADVKGTLVAKQVTVATDTPDSGYTLVSAEKAVFNITDGAKVIVTEANPEYGKAHFDVKENSFVNITRNATLEATVFNNYGSVSVSGANLIVENFYHYGTQANFNDVVLDITSFVNGSETSPIYAVIGGKSKVNIDKVSGNFALRLADGTVIKDGSSIGGATGVRNLGKLTIGETANDKIHFDNFDNINAAGHTITVNGIWSIAEEGKILYGKDGSYRFSMVGDEKGKVTTILNGAGTININTSVIFEGRWPAGSDYYSAVGKFLIEKDLTVNVTEVSGQSHIRFTFADVTIKGKFNTFGTEQDSAALKEAVVTVTGSNAELNIADELSVGYDYIYQWDPAKNDSNKNDYKSTLNIKNGALVTVGKDLFLNLDSVINIAQSTLTVEKELRNYGGIVNISGKSTVDLTVADYGTAAGAVNLANGTLLSGTLTAPAITIKGTASLAAYAAFSGAVLKGTLKAADTNTLEIAENSSKAVLLLAKGDYSGADFGDITIKGASSNAAITAAAASFNGNKISNAALYLTVENVTDGIELNADIALGAIKEINGNVVNNINGLYLYSVATDSGVETYRLDKVAGGIDISKTETDETDVLLSGKTISFKNSDDYSDIIFSTQAGNTTIKVASGNSKKDMEITVGGIEKSADGGVNHISVGNYANMDILGSVARLGNITVGHHAFLSIGEETSGTSASHSIKIGSDSEFTSKALNLAGGKAAFSAGKNAKVTIYGDYTVEEANNSITLADKARMTVTGDIINSSGDNYDSTTGEFKYASAIGSTIKIGKGATLDVDGNVVSVAGLTNYGRFFAENVYGTEKNNTVSFGTGAGAQVNALDLCGGQNSVKLGNGASLVANAVRNVRNYTLGNEATLTVMKSGLEGVQKFTAGKKSSIMLTALNGTEKNDTFSIGHNSRISGNTAMAFAAGNDTFKLGDNVTANLGAVDFGDGKDTMTIGKNSKVTLESLSGVETLNVGKETELRFTGVADIALDDVKGSWKNATLYDMRGGLTTDAEGVATLSGSTYGNEWDLFTFEVTGEENNEITLPGNASDNCIVDLYEYKDGNWNKLGALQSASEWVSELEIGGKYAVAVNVSDADMNKSKGTDTSYSFTLQLA